MQELLTKLLKLQEVVHKAYRGEWHVKLKGSKDWHPVKTVHPPKDGSKDQSNHYELADGRKVHQKDVSDLSMGKPMEKWQRDGSMTMVNREAHYQALAAVKDHVLSYVANLVRDMKNDEVKNVYVAGGEVTIRKIMADMYSGHVRKGTEIVHQFDRITIPQLAGQLQSLLELYDPASVPEQSDPKALLVERLKPLAEQAKGGLVGQLLSFLDGEKPQAAAPKPEDSLNKEIAEIIAEANAITDEAKNRMQRVDPRTEVLDLKERVEQMLARVESLVSEKAPTSQDEDKLHDTLHQMQMKHDHLVDRAQHELNILTNRVEEVSARLDKLKDVGSGGKTITIRVE
jgi:hypothetical protein